MLRAGKIQSNGATDSASIVTVIEMLSNAAVKTKV